MTFPNENSAEAPSPSHMPELRKYAKSADSAKHIGDPSPFQGIMADILADIFLWAVQMDNNRRMETSRNWEIRAPMNVVAVCRHWAAVALSCPSLWSVFRGSNKNGSTGIDFPWKHLETFLRRSQQIPFDLSIHIYHGTPMDYEKLLDILPRNATRFRTLDIYWSSQEIPKKTWKINLQLFSFLEDLCLHVCHVRNPLVSIDLSDAPHLKRLELRGYFTLTYDRQLRCPSLVSADFSGTCVSVIETPNSVPRRFSWLDCLLIIQASPSLTTFSAPRIENILQDTILRGRGPVIEERCTIHYKLTSLNLHLEYRDAARHLFEHLNLPNLTDVTLERPTGSWPSEFGEMISRSKATIRKFVVCDYKLSEATRCLQYMPALQTLSVKGGSFEYADLRNSILRLTMKPESQLCPELEHIEFRSCSDPYYFAEELTAMIFSRWDRSIVGDKRCLKSVKLKDHANREDPYSFPSQFLQFRQEGLVIEGLAENNLWNE